MASAAGEHLRAIAALPRPAGSEAEAEVRSYCQLILGDAGFEGRHVPFEYSTFVGRWGTPLFGVATSALMVAAANEGAWGRGERALGVLVAGAIVLGVIGALASRRGVLDLPLGRLRGINYVATRGTPTLWLVAHLDSKSQPIPIVVRVLAIMASMIFLGVAMGVAIAQIVAPIPIFVWFALAVAELVASVPVMASVVGSRSNGALDNASGVATVLRVAELLPRDIAIGVILTSAEELGLAGARALARSGARITAIKSQESAINIDGIDDTGEVRVIYSGRMPRALLERLGPAWPAPVKLPPGVLMDGVALADAGWEVVNISKGSWRTVSRIHTPSDNLSNLSGSGAEGLAVALARAIAASPR